MDFKLAYEYRDVAERASQQAASRRSPSETERLIVELEDVAEPVLVLDRHRPLSSDPADDMVLDVAINGKVDAIVTYNLKHLREPGRRFGIAVLTPEEFLIRIRKDAAHVGSR